MLPASFTFDLYPIICAIAVLASLFCIEMYFRHVPMKKGIATDYELLITISAGVGFICAVLFQNVYDLIEDPSTYTWTWAMTFFGGLVGGVATFFIGWAITLRKKHPNSLMPLLTIAGGGIPLAHSLGRFACTLDGCCYGAEIDPSSPFYWMGIEFRTTPGVKVWPTQLMECIFLAILAAILLTVAFKKNSTLTLPIYGICYGIWRFCIEFLRGDHRGNLIPGISPSQFWALVLFVGCTVYLILMIVKKKLSIYDFELELANKEIKEETNKKPQE